MPALPGHCQPLPSSARTLTDTKQRTSRRLLSLINKTAIFSIVIVTRSTSPGGRTFRSAFLTGACRPPVGVYMVSTFDLDAQGGHVAHRPKSWFLDSPLHALKLCSLLLMSRRNGLTGVSHPGALSAVMSESRCRCPQLLRAPICTGHLDSSSNATEVAACPCAVYADRHNFSKIASCRLRDCRG